MNTFKLTEEECDDFVYWLCCLFVEALPKTVGQLERYDSCHCCLGVGVACTVQEDKLRLNDQCCMIGAYPTSTYDSPDWLKEIDSEFESRKGKALTYLNDTDDLSHPEIAARITEAFKDELGSYYKEIKETFKEHFV